MSNDQTVVDNFFCVAPWVNIHVGTLENLQPCCAGAGIKAGLYQLPEYLGDTSLGLHEIKKSFLDQKVPSACQGCQEYNWYSQFSEQAPTGIDDFTLLSLDLRWSTTCNLTCMYCGAGNSSAWATLENRAGTIPINSRIRDRDALFDLIAKHQSGIQRISLLGGEPLLLKENIKVLELVRSDIEINIFTGLNVDLESNQVFEILADMPNVYWTVSMENVGPKFEFVRRGADWSTQLKNLEILLARNRSQYTVTLQSQFCAYSATSISELYDFVGDMDIKINWNWLQHPAELNFFHFPDRHKLISLQQLESLKSLSNKFFYEPQVEHIIAQLRASLGHGDQHHVAKCRKWHEEMESRYFEQKLDFVSLWPEFAT